MDFQWDDLLRALALLMVLEGLLPFVGPARFRETLLRIGNLNDRTLRMIGLGSMIAGLLLLQLTRL